jgi:hypothetical protein
MTTIAENIAIETHNAQTQNYYLDYIRIISALSFAGGKTIFDGVTDATMVIQNAADSLEPGMALLLPPAGTYSISAPIILDIPYVTILTFGNSENSAKVKNINKSNDTIFHVKAQGVSFQNIRLEGYYDIDGIPQQNGTLYDWALPDNDSFINRCTFAYLDKCVNVKGRNIRAVDNIFAASRVGIDFNLSDVAGPNGNDLRSSKIENNIFHGMGIGTFANTDKSYCIQVNDYSPAAHMKISNNYFEQGKSGLFKGYIGGINLSDNMAKGDGNGEYDIYILGHHDVAVPNLSSISNNVLDRKGTAENIPSASIYCDGDLDLCSISNHKANYTSKDGIVIKGKLYRSDICNSRFRYLNQGDNAAPIGISIGGTCDDGILLDNYVNFDKGSAAIGYKIVGNINSNSMIHNNRVKGAGVVTIASEITLSGTVPAESITGRIGKEHLWFDADGYLRKLTSESPVSYGDGSLVNLTFRNTTGSPVGSLTPKFLGEEYFDTSGVKWYKATGLTNTDWVALN